uniref:G-protein coupled receptors family 1 profile domain-containing protein n=1 Tax=Mycena chlorophos TaxID=658473 RepID=A0ABQ0KV07_MYCCL|nr:predicted protein [Mycena chlorophos]
MAASADDGTEVLHQLGHHIAAQVLQPVAETGIVAAYTLILAFVIVSACRRGLERPGSRVMLAVLIQLYLTSVVLWTLTLGNFFTFLSVLFFRPYPDNTPLTERLNQAQGSTASLSAAAQGLFLLNVCFLSSVRFSSQSKLQMLVGNCVVIWRVRVIYRRSHWLALLAALLLVCFGFSLTDAICLGALGLDTSRNMVRGGAVCAHTELVAWTTSVALNVCSTSLIWFKAWQHRRLMRVAGAERRSTTGSVHHTLSRLAESGFAYCLILLTQIILFVPTRFGTPGIYFFFSLAALGDHIIRNVSDAAVPRHQAQPRDVGRGKSGGD